MAIYGSNSKETRERLARRRLEFRICCRRGRAGMLAWNPVDDLADENGGATKSNDADRLLAHVEALGWKVWREKNNRDLMVTTKPGEHFPLRSASTVHALLRAREKAGMKPVVAPKDTAPRVIAHLAARCAGPDAPCWPGALRTARAKSGAILIDRGTKDFSAYCVTAAGVDRVDAATVEREDVRFLRLEGARPFENGGSERDIPRGRRRAGEADPLRPPRGRVGARQGSSWRRGFPTSAIRYSCSSGRPGAGKTSAARETKNILDPESGQVDFGGKKNKSIRRPVRVRVETPVSSHRTTCRTSATKSRTPIARSPAAHPRARGRCTPTATRRRMFAHCALMLTAVEDNILRRSDLLDRGSFFELTPPKIADRRRHLQSPGGRDQAEDRRRAPERSRRDPADLRPGGKWRRQPHGRHRRGAARHRHAVLASRRSRGRLPGDAKARGGRERRSQAVHPRRPAGRRRGAPLGGWSKREWRGSATDLLTEANAKREWPSCSDRNAPAWPGDATRASKTLNAEQGVLARLGVEVTTGKTGGARWISLVGREDASSGGRCGCGRRRTKSDIFGRRRNDLTQLILHAIGG